MNKAPAPRFSRSEARALHAKAHKAGEAAARVHVPEPMHVVQRANPFDDSSPVVRRYAPVMEGVCGFAWVVIYPGNSSFARHMRRMGHSRKGYGGGEHYWVSGYGQSMERKAAYAQAYAEVLREAGVRAFGQSRMD